MNSGIFTQKWLHVLPALLIVSSMPPKTQWTSCLPARWWDSRAAWMVEVCKLALCSSVLLSSQPYRSADNKVQNSPVGRWFANWIHTKKKIKEKKDMLLCCRAESDKSRGAGENPGSLIQSPDSFLIYCAVKRWFNSFSVSVLMMFCTHCSFLK